MGNVVAIHQPNFMPWIGYFYKIYQSDTFIFLDDVQIQKKGASFSNRVSILVEGKEKYLTIPIKRGSGIRNINTTRFNDNRWKNKITANLQANYARANFFKENKDLIFDLIHFDAENLADYNINFIKTITKKLCFNVDFIKSSKFEIKSTSTERLIELVKLVNGKVYLSGSGGDKYQNCDLYKNAMIVLQYNKVPNFSYRQLKTESFVTGLSIIDAIFNIGFDVLINEIFIPE